MVDCGSLRCAQERRSLRRDLQSLSKKLPLILGLESIAALYVNSEEREPVISSVGEEKSPSVCQDFQACSRCHYCEKKIPNIYKRIDRIIGDVRKGKENKGKICLRSLQDLMPFCLDFYTHGFGRELFSESVKNYFMMASPEVQGEEPKEVGSKSTSQASSQTGKLVVPYHLEDNRPNKLMGSSRTDEEEEDEDMIDKELKDQLLSEHITMPHTLPFSFLNGKIIKKENDHSARDHTFPFITKDAGFYPLPNPLQLANSVYIQHSDYKDLPLIGTSQDAFASPFIHSLPSQEGAYLLRELHLAHIRRLHNISGSSGNPPRPAHGSQLKLPLLVNIVRKLVHERFMEIKKLHRNKQVDKNKFLLECETFNPLKAFAPTTTAIPSLEDEALYARPGKRNESVSLQYNYNSDTDSLLKHFGKVNECSRIGDTLKDIIGKTISEKMKFKDISSDENSNPNFPKLYKAQSLQTRNPLKRASSLYKREADSTTFSDKDSSPAHKHSKKEIAKSRCFMNKSPVESGAKSLKKTRPKRGQYRKYNSQLLMDAVRAVQRGEMSVHRAGSFFGVPHSTLEYKVKERHLLRQRKGRDGGSVSSASPPKSEAPLVTTINLSRDSSPALSEASLTSKKFNEPLNSKTSTSSPPSLTSNFDEKKNYVAGDQGSKAPLSLSPAQVPCPPFPLSGMSQEFAHVAWLQPYLSSSTQCDSTVAFPAPGMSLNTSASELLRKLQHKVQSKDCLSHETALQLPYGKESSYEIVASKENSSGLAESLAVFH